MNPDICMNALTPKISTPTLKSYTVKFKDGEFRGKKFATANDLFKNSQPEKCPVLRCIIDKPDCLNPDMSKLINTFPHTDEKNGKKNVLLFANTTNGPEYSREFCVQCSNRIESKNFKVSIKKEDVGCQKAL